MRRTPDFAPSAPLMSSPRPAGMDLRSLLGLSPVRGERVDDQDVDRDDDRSPDGVRGDEQEVGDGAQPAEHDSDDPRPELTQAHPEPGGHEQDPEREVDPAPAGVIQRDDE